jgi:hypothetical protein
MLTLLTHTELTGAKGWEPSEFLAALMSFCMGCKDATGFPKVKKAMSSYQVSPKDIPITAAARNLFKTGLGSTRDKDYNDYDF